MASPTQSWRPHKPTIVLFLLFISFSSSIEKPITSSNKLDQPPDTEIKCGSCPCGYTCGEQSPPPPPPTSPPPPPPPPPKYPSCPQNCNPLSPPPPPRFIYVPVPGQVYQPKPTWIYYYSGAANRAVGFLVLALGGLSLATIFG